MIAFTILTFIIAIAAMVRTSILERRIRRLESLTDPLTWERPDVDVDDEGGSREW